MIIIIVLLILLVLPTEAAPKTEVVTLTKEQWDSLNSKLELWGYGLLAFIAKEAWEMLKGKGRALKDIEEKIGRILTKLEGMPSKDEAREIARNEVKHYHEISG